jgi:hypothetical protein
MDLSAPYHPEETNNFHHQADFIPIGQQ